MRAKPPYDRPQAASAPAGLRAATPALPVQGWTARRGADSGGAAACQASAARAAGKRGGREPPHGRPQAASAPFGGSAARAAGKRGGRHQFGAALLMAMITVALVATLAAGALWRQWRGVEIERAERARAQADWLLTGALDWGRLILQGDFNEDRRKGQLVDDLTEPWAVPLAEARLSSFLAAGEASGPIEREAFVSGQISDLQARLNVMNLVAGGGEQQLQALTRFGRLFEQLGLPSGELGALQRALARAQQAAAGTLEGGADAPLLPARFDQLAWLGLAPRTLALLRPYVTVLPLADGRATPVNLNTASAEVIYAAVPELDRAQAERLLALRAQSRLDNPRAAASALGRNDLSLDWAAVNSSFFELRARLRLDDAALEEVAVVQRASDLRGHHVRTLWRAQRARHARGRPMNQKE